MSNQCDGHNHFTENVESLAASVARLETSVNWIVRIGKWGIGVVGALLLFGATTWGTFAYKANEVYASVKVQEAMIATIMAERKHHD